MAGVDAVGTGGVSGGAVRGRVSQRGPRGGRSLGAGREARRRSRWGDRGAVWVGTEEFGTLRGTIVLPVSGTGHGVGVSWDPSLRLPGLRHHEQVHTRSGPRARRGAILAADGTPLAATALGASIAGQAGGQATGWERIYDRRSSGRPAAELLFGARVIARAPKIAGRSLPTTISPKLMTAAAAALGQQLGGVAAIRPRDGAVRALAGAGSVSTSATRVHVQDHHPFRRTSKRGRDALNRLPDPHLRDPVRSRASKRRRGGLRRVFDRGVHRVVAQLGVRAARGRARRAHA